MNVHFIKWFIPTCVGYTDFLCLFLRVNVRFIPTCVGYTDLLVRASSLSCGSSPLAWGIPLKQFHESFTSYGSSPLAWGIRFRFFLLPYPFLVHPHLRGVYLLVSIGTVSNSPVHPHLRGVYRRGGYTDTAATRFIPTCVGYTGAGNFENSRRDGSSPLAWGIH